MAVILTNSAAVFACHSSACRPPTSGGTGGSKGTGKDRRNAAEDTTAMNDILAKMRARRSALKPSIPSSTKGIAQHVKDEEARLAKLAKPKPTNAAARYSAWSQR